eukprot:TRINITY_DN12759_c0_g1_i2.p1 TRINITY_DN12759_c0_g1~~TRINITY_DN12759_c0_g1_i2.p1  ORF type:complete len:305 (+),score=70.74 TRINITY_DN12759_c0_g1_i2:56-916(+)
MAGGWPAAVVLCTWAACAAALPPYQYRGLGVGRRCIDAALEAHPPGGSALHEALAACSALGANEPPLPASHYPLRFWCLTLSNAAFLPVIWVAWSLGAVPEMAVYIVAMVASLTYHMCDEQDDLCALPYDAHQFFDFFGAFYAVVVTVVYMARLRPQGRQLILTQAALWLALAAVWDRLDPRMWAAPVTAPLVVMAYQWWRYCAGGAAALGWFRWRFFIGGSASAAAGFLCVLLWEPSNYAAAHSLWHCFIAAAPALLLHAPATPQRGTPYEAAAAPADDQHSDEL